MRIVLALAILAVVTVATSERARDRMGHTLGLGQASLPAGARGSAPPGFRDLLSGFGSATAAGTLRRRAGGLPGVFAGRPGSSGADVPRPFADVGPPRQVARVKRDLRAALRRRRAGDGDRSSERGRVAAFHGVFVAGSRAVVLLDHGRSVRAGGRWRELPLERRKVALRREGGRWRVER